MDEITINRAAMGRLAKALAFICGSEQPAVRALAKAAQTGADRDIKEARKLFLALKPGDRCAALAMIEDR